MMEKYCKIIYFIKDQSKINEIKAKHIQISNKLKNDRMLVNSSDFFLPE